MGRKVVGSDQINVNRYQELKKILVDRRKAILSEVQAKMKDIRTGSDDRRMNSESRTVEGGLEEDIELALVQMKAETLTMINEALDRLGYGDYGKCHECQKEIDVARLKALPYARLCKDCEEDRETQEMRDRERARRQRELLGRNSF